MRRSDRARDRSFAFDVIDRITVSEKGDVSIYPARPAEEPPAAPGAFVGNG